MQMICSWRGMHVTTPCSTECYHIGGDDKQTPSVHSKEGFSVNLHAEQKHFQTFPESIPEIFDFKNNYNGNILFP